MPEVFPIVTALALVGTPVVQFVARLQLPEPAFQLSAVTSGRTAINCGVGR
jgi:hypothetical protein